MTFVGVTLPMYLGCTPFASINEIVCLS